METYFLQIKEIVSMNKIAIITDSNSGITQAQGKELGVRVIPMPFYIDGELLYEDITLTQEEFYKRLEEGADIATSQTAPGEVIKLWEELLETHDEIIHIPMSSGLSGSCETAMMLAKDFNGKVQVVNNQRISVTQRQSVLDAIDLAKKGKTAVEIKKILEDTKFDASIYITLETLKYLKKGGRITPAAAAIGTVLNLKPVLQIQGEKLDAYAKARGKKQAKRIMLEAIKKDMESKFNISSTDKFTETFKIQAAYTGNYEEALEWAEEIKQVFPGFDFHMDPLSLSIACHIGYGALAITCSKYLKDI